MKYACFKRVAHIEGISWTLILAFLSLTLFPYHYHLHHTVDSAEQAVGLQNHVIDIHGQMDASGFSHHDDSHTIKPAMDVPIKKLGVQLPWVVILMALMLIIPLLALQGRLHPGSIEPQPARFSPYLSPQLRAPPRT